MEDEDNGNAPADATAMQAEAIVRAAIEWRTQKGPNEYLSLAEWELYQAVTNYGNVYKGVKGR